MVCVKFVFEISGVDCIFNEERGWFHLSMFEIMSANIFNFDLCFLYLSSVSYSTLYMFIFAHKFQKSFEKLDPLEAKKVKIN